MYESPGISIYEPHSNDYVAPYDELTTAEILEHAELFANRHANAYFRNMAVPSNLDIWKYQIQNQVEMFVRLLGLHDATCEATLTVIHAPTNFEHFRNPGVYPQLDMRLAIVVNKYTPFDLKITL